MVIYELAFNLKITVGQLLEMPYEEFLGWLHFFKIRPVGWQEDNRTALLLSAQGVKKKATEIFPSLAALYKGNRSSNKSMDPNFLRMLQKAKSGDNWEIEIED